MGRYLQAALAQAPRHVVHRVKQLFYGIWRRGELREWWSGILPYLMPEDSATPDLVELSLELFEVVIRRDFGAIEGFYAPDAILRGAEVGTFEGPAAIRGLFEDMLSPYEEVYGEIEEIVSLGNGVILVVPTANGRLNGSSGLVRIRYATVASIFVDWNAGTSARPSGRTPRSSSCKRTGRTRVGPRVSPRWPTRGGGDYFLTREDRKRITQRLVRQLERLGQTVTLEPTTAEAG